MYGSAFRGVSPRGRAFPTGSGSGSRCADGPRRPVARSRRRASRPPRRAAVPPPESLRLLGSARPASSDTNTAFHSPSPAPPPALREPQREGTPPSRADAPPSFPPSFPPRSAHRPSRRRASRHGRRRRRAGRATRPGARAVRAVRRNLPGRGTPVRREAAAGADGPCGGARDRGHGRPGRPRRRAPARRRSRRARCPRLSAGARRQGLHLGSPGSVRVRPAQGFEPAVAAK